MLPEQKTSASFNISFNEEITPGTYPLVLKVTYHDANMYQFSTVSCHLMKTADSPSSKIRGSIENIDITQDESGIAILKIWNDADETLDLNISFFSSNEIKTSFKPKEILINSSEEKQIQIDVESFGALTGSSYVVFASLEYEDEEYHYTSSASGHILIVENNINSFLELNQETIMLWLAIIVFVILIIVYIFYKFGRGK